MNIHKNIKNLKDIENVKKLITVVEKEVMNKAIRNIPYDFIFNFFLNNLDKSIIALCAYIQNMKSIAILSSEGMELNKDLDLSGLYDIFQISNLDEALEHASKNQKDFSLEFTYKNIHIPVIKEKKIIESDSVYGSDFTGIIYYEYEIADNCFIETLLKKLYKYSEEVISNIRTKYNLNKSEETPELTILIKDDVKFGIGTARKSEVEDYFLSDMYQNRIPDIKEKNETVYIQLQDSKMYVAENNSLLAAANAILDFWFIKPINKLPKIPKFKSIKDASENLLQSNHDYLIFETTN